MKDILIKALKDAGRVVVLAIIPIAIDGIQKGFVDWRLIAVTGAVALLKFIDKLLHEIGVENEDENLITGLTRF